MRVGYVCGGNTKIHDRFYAEESKNKKSKMDESKTKESKSRTDGGVSCQN